MRNIIVVSMNILKITFRKKSNIIVFLILPVVIALASMALFGNGSSRPAAIGVSNLDGGTLSEGMIKDLKKIEKFNIVKVKETDINSVVSEGKTDCVLMIPENFSESIYNGQISKINVVSIKGEASTGWIESYITTYIGNLMNIAKASEGERETFNKIYENFRKGEVYLKSEKVSDVTNGKQVTTSGIGFLIMFMMLGTSITSSLILKEKKIRTYFRILSSPVSETNYILGNVFANLFIIFIQSSLVIIGITRLLQINTFVHDWEMLVILLAFGLVSIGFGLMIVAFSTTSNMAGYLSTFIITPTCMLGGCFWPVEFMPVALRHISSFIPQRWALESVSKIQNGSSFSDIIINLTMLIVFSAVLFLIAAYRMKITSSVKNFV